MRGPPGCPGKEELTSSLETLIHAAAMTEICIATMVKADHSPLVPCSLRTFLGWVVVWPVLANSQQGLLGGFCLYKGRTRLAPPLPPFFVP